MKPVAAVPFLRPVANHSPDGRRLLVGWVAFRQLPISALPQVDYPTIQVQTFYPAPVRRHGILGHRATGAPVRPDTRPEPE